MAGYDEEKRVPAILLNPFNEVDYDEENRKLAILPCSHI